MTGLDIYVLILCLIVFTLLTAVSCAMVAFYVKAKIKLISHGIEDEIIITEYQKQKSAKPAGKIISGIFSAFVFALLLAFFVVSVAINLSCVKIKKCVAVPQVVMSDSMQYRNEHNTYLDEHGLYDQINTFDLIFTEKLPGEFELELYDIVVYEYRDELIIHRIVGIEEPNAAHPEHRHFLLQGDSVRWTDEFPVLYSQMRAIYKGERIPYVGSFFAFMRTPLGYLCILLVVFSMIATPIAKKKLKKAIDERLEALKLIENIESTEDEEKETVEVGR